MMESEEATDDNCRREIGKIMNDFYWEIMKNNERSLEMRDFVDDRRFWMGEFVYHGEFIEEILNREVGFNG